MKGGIGSNWKPEGAAKATSPETSWPKWAQRLVTIALVVHIIAILAGALAAPPSSTLEQRVAGLFAVYHQIIDQGYSYRYYAPEPGPTAVATARIRFSDGRPEQTIRLPERGTWPKLRYQRQLALANHLADDFRLAQSMTGQGDRSRWARSYARHLAKEHKGCVEVSLFLQSHEIPPLDRIRQELASSGASGVNLDADEFFTAPERIGDYPCDAF